MFPHQPKRGPGIDLFQNRGALDTETFQCVYEFRGYRHLEFGGVEFYVVFGARIVEVHLQRDIPPVRLDQGN